MDQGNAGHLAKKRLKFRDVFSGGDMEGGGRGLVLPLLVNLPDKPLLVNLPDKPLLVNLPDKPLLVNLPIAEKGKRGLHRLYYLCGLFQECWIPPEAHSPSVASHLRRESLFQN